MMEMSKVPHLKRWRAESLEASPVLLLSKHLNCPFSGAGIATVAHLGFLLRVPCMAASGPAGKSTEGQEPLGTQNCQGSLQPVAGRQGLYIWSRRLPAGMGHSGSSQEGREVTLRPGSCWSSREGSVVMDLARQLKLKR